MKELTINIDMDGVVYDMMGVLVGMANSKAAREKFDFSDATLHADVGDWDIAASWGMPSKNQFWKFFYWAIGEGLFFRGQEVPGALEAVGNLVAGGHRVRLVTSKQFNEPGVTFRAQSDVLNWLAAYAPEWSHKVEVAFTGNKQGYDADVIIDDKPTLAWAQQGKVNVLFDHTWNKQVDAMPVGMYPCIPHLYRAESWKQVEYLVGRVSVKGGPQVRVLDY